MINLDNKIKNILAVRNDRFGEFLLNIPALRALKESFPGARLTVVTSEYVKDLGQRVDIIDEIITFENHRHNFFELFKFIKEISRRKFDVCVVLNPSKEFNVICFFAGIPVRVGYNRKWPFFLTHKMEDKKYLGEKHEVEYNLDLVSLIGASSEDKSLSLDIEDETIDSFERFIIGSEGRLIAIHPWTSDPIKEWETKNFLELSLRLTKDLKQKVVIVGGPGEEAKSAIYFNQLENVLNLTGKTSLTQLAALLRKCKFLISADSGPMHLASCVGTPVLALFRNDLPGKTAKRWAPWSTMHLVIEKKDLREITVDEVYSEVKEAVS